VPSAPKERATLCDMRTVTHREMRNQSGDILRHVAAGETIQVTNNGQVAALIVPPGADPLADLVSRVQVREARTSPSSLRLIVRRKGTAASQAIVADVRGRW
jgi:prevent-host-death family protein